MLTILQGSDVHFGKHHDPRAAEHFLGEVERVDPEVLVLAGDFTQRAKVGEYEDVRRLLESLGGRRVVVTPGNHDVALYRFWERIGFPFRNYKKFVHADLNHAAQFPGATFVSLNTAAPRRAVVNGRLDRAQLDFAARVFQGAPAGDLKCAVMHHPLSSPPDGGEDPPLPGNERSLARITEMGVEIVFGGHLHRGFALRPGDGAPVLCHSGTATSNRGRRAESGRNSFNVVRVDDAVISVTCFMRQGGGAFEETWTEDFPRDRATAPAGEPMEGGQRQ